MRFRWHRGAAVIEDEFVKFRLPFESYDLPLIPRPEEDAGRPAFVRFASLGNAPCEEIVDFASKFGPLGLAEEVYKEVLHGFIRLADYAELKGRAPLADEWRGQYRRAIAGALMEVLGNILEGLQREGELKHNTAAPTGSSEPLSWWRGEARRMETLLCLVKLTDEAEGGGDYRAEERLLSGIRDIAGVKWEPKDILSWRSPTCAERVAFVIEVVRAVICDNINQRLQGPTCVAFSQRSGWSLTPVPRILLEALYAQLAFSLVGRFRVQVCQNSECPSGAWFIPQHGRQEYCSDTCRWAANKRAQRRRRRRRTRQDSA
ncbi:MAG: hypothetical protein AB1563_09805 [Bacillota bacterium]